jgi:hypothetical protein
VKRNIPKGHHLPDKNQLLCAEYYQISTVWSFSDLANTGFCAGDLRKLSLSSSRAEENVGTAEDEDVLVIVLAPGESGIGAVQKG